MSISHVFLTSIGFNPDLFPHLRQEQVISEIENEIEIKELLNE